MAATEISRKRSPENPDSNGSPKDDDEDEYIVFQKRRRPDPTGEHPLSRSCPYLDTINRSILDFDFEKLCSISLSNNNVYACLVCGKYFQGRGRHSHAYTHSVQLYHHVFLNLETLRFYCLPDNYEIIDPSLEDIKYICRPTFSKDHVTSLDQSAKWSIALDGTKYLPGIVGLNNIKANDYMNVILHTLAHVGPFRDFFLREENYNSIARLPGDQTFSLVQRLGELFRKLWNPRHFRAHVSPHEMLQAVSSVSKKNFKIIEQGDPIEFVSWLLNTLHYALCSGKRKGKSIVHETFEGEMKIYTRKLPPPTENEDEIAYYMESEEYQRKNGQIVEQMDGWIEKETTSPFLYLALDLPAPPLFQDELEKNIIPQIPLFDLLNKFNGAAEKEYKTHRESFVKKFEITKLPPYLILCIKRFTKNNFFVEKNPTIVNFPIKDIDMAEFLSSDPAVQDAHPHSTYDLIANICHDGQAGSGKGTYRVHIRHKGANQWFELQDLHVKDLLPQMITLAEAYIQIWELRTED